MFFVHFAIDEKSLPLVRSGSNKSCIVMISDSDGIQIYKNKKSKI